VSDAPQGPDAWTAPTSVAAPPSPIWGPPPPSEPFDPYAVVLPHTPPPRPPVANVWVILGSLLGLLVSVGAVVFVLHRDIHHANHGAPVILSLPTRTVTDTETVTSDRTADRTVVNEAMARQVLTRYWQLHEQALVQRDLPVLAGLSAGSARRWEQASVACACLRVDAPRPLLSASYFVPRQTSFPASFVAEASTEARGAYWAELLVFTKAAAGAPWLVTQDSGFGPPPGVGPRLGRPDLGPGGYDQPVSAAQSSVAQQVAGRFAAVWQQAKDTGRVPIESGFDLTGQTGQRVAELASHTQDGVQVNGAVGHYVFSVSRTDALVQVSDHGYDLACQPIHEVVQYRALAGQMIHQGSTRDQWGPALAPGDYQRVTSTDVWETCFLIPPTVGTPISVLDQDIGGALTTAPASLT
jgi:hypothetical protein